MKKLLGREPTPEIWSAIHGAICGEYNEEGFYNAIYNAAPSLPEPGEVEQECRRDVFDIRDARERLMKAADLIAALEAEILNVGESLAVEVTRREKAEAERDAYQATADHHYSEAFNFKTENERLRAFEVVRMLTKLPQINDYAAGWNAAIDAARSKT